jgi:MFS family permease
VVAIALGAALIGVFVLWQRRVLRAGGQPLLDLRLFTQTRGYAVGAGVGTLYFVGFSGVWLVFALFFQHGLGYSPLESGLAVTPFAVGSAGAAVVAGRLVERLGRLLTVCGLGAVILGMSATALLLRFAPEGAATWLAAPALFVAGMGSGSVISPNITMTLRDVPVRMAGAAGGALQTGQRLGAAVGTAALPGLFYLVLARDDDNFRDALAIALGAALIGMTAALGLAVADWRRDRRGRQEDAGGSQEAAGSPVRTGRT